VRYARTILVRYTVSALITIGLLSLPSPAIATRAPVRTMVVADVTPFTVDGYLRGGLRVALRTSGSCGPGSDVLPNDVYRCGYRNWIVDPCWRDFRSAAPTVVCLGEPWGRTVIQLRLAAPPAPSSGRPNLKAEPWGITLVSGARCLAFQGAHDRLTGREGSPPIDYYCSKTLALVRGIDRGHPVWTIRAARITHQLSHPYVLIGPVSIKAAWFGGNNPLTHHP
jgi:hypothetical protein